LSFDILIAILLPYLLQFDSIQLGEVWGIGPAKHINCTRKDIVH